MNDNKLRLKLSEALINTYKETALVFNLYAHLHGGNKLVSEIFEGGIKPSIDGLPLVQIDGDALIIGEYGMNITQVTLKEAAKKLNILYEARLK